MIWSLLPANSLNQIPIVFVHLLIILIQLRMLHHNCNRFDPKYWWVYTFTLIAENIIPIADAGLFYPKGRTFVIIRYCLIVKKLAGGEEIRNEKNPS